MKKSAKSRYRAKITVGHEEDGTPIYKYASGKTKAERDKNKEELKRRYINGAIEVERERLFGDFVLEWFDSAKKDLSVSTKQTYASTLNKHILPEFKDRQLRAISRADLQTFIDSKADMKPSSLGNMMYIFRQAFGLAYADGIIDRNPTDSLKKPSSSKDHRRALTDLETQAVLRVADTNSEGLLLSILYFTGVRIGEALGLQWLDISKKDKTLKVQRDIDFHDGSKPGTVKTAAAVRSIPMPTPLIDAMRKVPGVGPTYVIKAPITGDNLCESTYRRQWKRLMREVAAAAEEIIEEQRAEKEAGHRSRIDRMIETKVMNPKAKKQNQVMMSILTPHYFRHNYATILYDADVDILSAQHFLGHADVKTTLAIYSHLSKEKEAKKAESVRQAFDVIYKVAKRLPSDVKEELLKD